MNTTNSNIPQSYADNTACRLADAIEEQNIAYERRELLKNIVKLPTTFSSLNKYLSWITNAVYENMNFEVIMSGKLQKSGKSFSFVMQPLHETLQMTQSQFIAEDGILMFSLKDKDIEILQREGANFTYKISVFLNGKNIPLKYLNTFSDESTFNFSNMVNVAGKHIYGRIMFQDKDNKGQHQCLTLREYLSTSSMEYSAIPETKITGFEVSIPFNWGFRDLDDIDDSAKTALKTNDTFMVNSNKNSENNEYAIRCLKNVKSVESNYFAEKPASYYNKPLYTDYMHDSLTEPAVYRNGTNWQKTYEFRNITKDIYIDNISLNFTNDAVLDENIEVKIIFGQYTVVYNSEYFRMRKVISPEKTQNYECSISELWLRKEISPAFIKHSPWKIIIKTETKEAIDGLFILYKYRELSHTIQNFWESPMLDWKYDSYILKPNNLQNNLIIMPDWTLVSRGFIFWFENYTSCYLNNLLISFNNGMVKLKYSNQELLEISNRVFKHPNKERCVYFLPFFDEINLWNENLYIKDFTSMGRFDNINVNFEFNETTFNQLEEIKLHTGYINLNVMRACGGFVATAFM